MSYLGFSSLAALIVRIQRMPERDEVVARVISGEGLAEGQEPIERQQHLCGRWLEDIPTTICQCGHLRSEHASFNRPALRR